MPVVMIRAVDVEMAVQGIIPYLEDTSKDGPTTIYFDGWYGIGASAVLRAIAEHPPQSLKEKFEKIIRIDCSRWKSRRALQRAIVDEIKLTQQVGAYFERQDEEEDFSGVDPGSRAEIEVVTTAIARYLAQYRCLVVFHNGSDGMVDLHGFGITQFEIFNTKILWTFGGRLNHYRGTFEKAQSSHLFLYPFGDTISCNVLLAEEAREITLYTHKLGLGITPEIATECCMYLLSLNHHGDGIIDYNWIAHASNYWVCDGIVQGGHDNKAWEIANALQHNIQLEEYSPNTVSSYFGSYLDISTKHWISINNTYFEEVPPFTTSLFFTSKKRDPLQLVPLPSDTFHKADHLRVLKLCLCSFSFSSPPFHCCSNLRFLGLDRCMDEQGLEEEEEKKRGARAVDTFHRLWVLDVCRTDWQLAFPLETQGQVTIADVREVHINKGRIWRNNLAWRRLPNLRRLRIVEPTSSWETGRNEEFMDMMHLELLDLSGNNTMQVLPNLSSTISLKTLVLDGCVGLEHIGPQGLPPSLESFCFDAGANEDHENEVKISRISLAGCSRLADFRLRGSLPNLVELDLSHTAVKMVDLTDEDAVQYLQKVLFMGCYQLRSIAWPQTRMRQLRLLAIDTGSGHEVALKASSRDSLLVCPGEKSYCYVFVAFADMRFLQSLESLIWIASFPSNKVNLCLSSTRRTRKDDGKCCYKEKVGPPDGNERLAAGSPLPKLLSYHDVSIENIATKIDGTSNPTQFQLLNFHMEIGEGVSDVPNTGSTKVRKAISAVMNMVESLHVHDSCSITSVVPGNIFMYPVDIGRESAKRIMNSLRWCHVERCPKLDIIFATNYDANTLQRLETIWAAHLLMARSLWSRPTRPRLDDWREHSFNHLRAIHLHFCPRLQYVHALSSSCAMFFQLETLHVHYCSDLRQVFPVEQEFITKQIPPLYPQGAMAIFPKLKEVYLQELPNLQLICEAIMFAPCLEIIHLRGCWSIRRLPAMLDCPPVPVDCEKECWDKLEWDGMESRHHPSLFQPRHSTYYKKRHLQGTVLR